MKRNTPMWMKEPVKMTQVPRKMGTGGGEGTSAWNALYFKCSSKLIRIPRNCTGKTGTYSLFQRNACL